MGDDGYSDLFGYVDCGCSLEQCDFHQIQAFSSRRNEYVAVSKELADAIIDTVWESYAADIEQKYLDSFG